MVNKQVEFNIGTLLSLEKHLNVPIEDLLFNAEIDDVVQSIIVMFGMGLTTTELEEYLKLDEPKKLSVDLKVNGALLDAFGIGKKSEEESLEETEEEQEKPKLFSEYIIDFMYMFSGVLGIHKNDFMKLKPVEVFAIYKAHNAHIRYMYQLNKIAHLNAIGLTSIKKFKEINPFSNKSEKGYRKSTLEKRKADLDFLYKVGEK